MPDNYFTRYLPLLMHLVVAVGIAGGMVVLSALLGKHRYSKAKQQSEERKQRCIEAQDKVKRYERARYIYKPIEGGQEIIFSEEERQKATVEAKKAVEEWCD